MFTSAQQTVTTVSSVATASSSATDKNVIGIVESTIWYCCTMFPITRSTWFLTWAMFRVDSTSKAESCFLPFVKAGILTSAHIRPTLSWMLKPRSASTRSPGKRLSKKRTVFRQAFVTCSSTPATGDVRDYALRNDAYQVVDGVMMLVAGECLCSCFKIWWRFNKKFKTINNHSDLLSEILLKFTWHCFLKIFFCQARL